ncbi:methenyltetrahydrofolate cyclohydrolase [Candidatus Aerophobetes bacterium Ae_b3a]|nr:MAG: methenyltetrahydrofolate cyclohydrolase [Candidatus Aerophobetes bacterium Ae_b3a]
MCLNQPLKSFIDNTAKGTPTPGGGSVAALVGSLGGALLCMVGNFTVGKPKYKSVEKDVKEILVEADKLKESLFVLIREDMEAYEKFSRASQMPKDTPLMREKRKQALQKTLKEAAEVPWRISQASLQVIELAEKLLPKGNPNLITDVGVGVLLAEAALKSAVLNVKINLSFIKDEEYKNRRSKALEDILSRASQIKDGVLKAIQEEMDG